MALSSRRMEWDAEVSMSNLEVHLYCNLTSSDFLFYISRFIFFLFQDYISIIFYAESCRLKKRKKKTGKPRLVHFTDI